MKLYTFAANGDAHVGALDGDHLADLTAAGIVGSMMDIIAGWPGSLDRIRAAMEGAPRYPLGNVRILPPIPRPGKVLCSGINYHSHFAENPEAMMPTEPFFFAKLSTSVIGHEDPIEHSERTKQLDYEVEFSAVIGRRLHRAKEEDVMPAIFGYTLLNDVSARDVQFKDAQITLGKNFNGFAPIGPCITTADEMTEPGKVQVRAVLNGRVMQDANTSEWLFPLPRLLSFLSHVMVLEPGDIVTTGTPAGVGLFQNPQVFMKAGDVIAIEADGIGRLENRIVAQAP
jgi:2-keto-4-pentenoate hydratase/2-oxohepta-3-ene-1,7-dioic acid hydratase in catechol pathway